MTLTLATAAANLGRLETPLLVLPLPAAPSIGAELQPVDRATNGAIARAVARRDFRGGRDETLHIPGGDTGVQRVLLVGMGKASDRGAALRRAGAIAARQATKLGVTELAFYAGALTADEAEAAGLGLVAGAWDFKEMKTPPPADEQRASLDRATLLAPDPQTIDAGVAAARAIGEGHSLARRLGMLPGNICTPDYLAVVAKDISTRFGMGITVLGRAEMEREKMGSFLCVAQGTPQDPKLIALEHMHGPKGAPPVIIVGKGLCFDSGGATAN